MGAAARDALTRSSTARMAQNTVTSASLALPGAPPHPSLDADRQ